MNDPEPLEWKDRQKSKPDDGETWEVVLCGGPYGDTKETGHVVHVRKGSVERQVIIPKGRSSIIWTRDSTVERWTFRPCGEDGIWRAVHGEEVPR